MYIRKAIQQDMETILSIYASAREFQKNTGNPTQWAGGYPQRELLEKDLKQGTLYVCLEDTELVGVFAYFTGEDPTYRKIQNGSWLNNKPYGTIHRIASAGTVRGVASFCFSWALKQCPNLRIDTHADNKVMQSVLLKNGFRYCGEIYTWDGTPRLAYQKEI